MAHTLIEKYKTHMLATALLAGVATVLVVMLGVLFWDDITDSVLLYSLVKIIVIVVPLLLAVAYLTFAERKIIGYMQVRIGPNRVGPRGWLQPIADALKLLMKEIVIPTNSNRFLFLIAPMISIAPALAAWAVLPFTDTLVLANIDASLLYILALTSMGVYGVIIAGWASNSKYAFLGAMRSAAQIVSYEIAMGFALVGVLIAGGSLNLVEIVQAQQGSVLHWFWLPLFPLFLVAPMISIAPALAAWAVLPFTDTLVLANIDASLLYILALTSMGVYGVIIAGWASNSKYAFLGAMRSAAQIVSYEIAMGFALVGVLIAGGSLNLVDIVQAQQGSVLHWFWLPLLPLFLVYFISGIAETNRAPFDVSEGESEIVAGFHVEYSGMAFAVFFLAEYANMILIAALAALMFLGGWLSPFEGILPDEFLTTGITGLVFGSGVHWLFAKTSLMLLFFLWFRATFPRYRYDQIMRLGWKVFIPITIVWLVIEGAAVVANVGPWFD